MRLKAISWIFLACLATALTSESEPRRPRHLHDIKQMIAYKLFTRNEPNCTQSQPSPPGTRVFQIPGFNDVVFKAVPKGSVTPPPHIEKIPSNSRIGIVGSYLGTNYLDETYNTLLGANNLFKSGMLEAQHGSLHKVTLMKPTTQKPVTPCLNTKPVHPPPVKPIGVVVKPPVVSGVVPTRYSYKQINQDGSVTTWSSYLDFNQGVKVTEDGKTLPFIIDRIRKIPVQFPVPVLPEVSKILSPNDGNFRHDPIKVHQSGSSYSYQQIHHDGRRTTYTSLPSLYNNYDDPGVVTKTRNTALPSIFFENVSASFPKEPIVDIVGPRPPSYEMPAGHVIYEAPLFENPMIASAPGYSYTQIHGTGGTTTAYQASGAFSAPPLNVFSNIPERNPFGPSIPHFKPYSYNQDHSSVGVANYAGTHKSGVQEHEEDFSASEPLAFGVQPPDRNSFSHRQTISDNKVTSYNGTEIKNQPIPTYITDRKENVAAGKKVNGIYESTLPLVDQFAYPIPNDFVQIPSVESSDPQKPIKPPSASGTSSYLYKHVHRDGSITSYGGDGSGLGLNDHTLKPATPTLQGNTHVFESPIYTGPFPIDVNTNAFKPSSPVSGAYSYKLLNNGQVDYYYDDRRNEASPTPESTGNDEAPVQGYVDHDNQYPRNPIFGQSSSLNQGAIPQGYSYTQTGYTQPNSFLTVNADNPAMAINYVNMKKSDINQQQYYSNPFQNYNEDFYPNSKDYVYIPPARYDEIPPPIKPLNLPRLPQKKFSNRFLYENFDGYNFRDYNFNLSPSTPKPQESSADKFYGKRSREQVQYNGRSTLNNRNFVSNNLVVVPDQVSTLKPANDVYVEQAPVQVSFNSQPSSSNQNPEFDYPTAAPEQVSIPNSAVNDVDDEQISIQFPSSPQSISSHQNSLKTNPITVQENTSFLFKQSNADGSSITTTNDGNTLSVQVEEARNPEAVQDEQPLGNVEERSRPVDEATSTVLVPVEEEEAARPEPEPSTEMPRRRKIKRVKVKHRGDIPDFD